MSLIEVRNLTKEFRLGQLQSIKATVKRLIGRRPAADGPHKSAFKALDGVSFSVEPGEVLGIIGHNGAGKSTLLKILSRITAPTDGQVRVNGTVAPLIEVGAGLIGDLTGRENIFLNGAILGMPRAEIARRFDDIVAFAELEGFIDTPLKRYSSGMQVRLGFAIATSMSADILIVDEVLSVGDLAFQRKSFDRMDALIRREGRTVLVVGHNLRQLERVCSRIIVLDHGRIIHDGKPGDACKLYMRLTNEKTREYVSGTRTRNDQIIRSDELDVERVDTYTQAAHESAREFALGEPIVVGINCIARQDLRDVEAVVGIHTPDFVYIASASTVTPGINISLDKGSHYVECVIDNVDLLPGVYAIRVSFLDRNSRPLWYGENLCFFSVTSGRIDPSRLPVLGFVNMDVSWRHRPGDGATVSLLSRPTAVPAMKKVGL